jgi:hypothetical protein
MSTSKITIAEAREWARKSFVAGLKIGHGDAEDFVEANYGEHGEEGIDKHITVDMIGSFRPEKKRPVVDKKKSSEERANVGFMEECCCARVWNHGFGAQCKKSPLEGGTMCKAHQETKDSLPEGDDLKHGYFNQERPLFMLTNADGREKGDTIAWADLKGEKKPRKSSAKKIPKAPKAEVKHPRPKGRAPKGKKWDHENGAWITIDPLPIEAPVAEVKQVVKPDEKPVEVIEKPVEVIEKPVEEVDEAIVDVVEEIVSKVEEDAGGAKNHELEEDGEKFIEYQGVKYLYDEDDKDVYTVDEMEQVGQWDGEKIIWSDEDHKSHHDSVKP